MQSICFHPLSYILKEVYSLLSKVCYLQVDIGRGVKPVGYYVQRSCGLFPAPLPQDAEDTTRAENMFSFMGAFFAKCIQDSRLVDIPLSRPFLKLICMGDVVDNVSQSYRELLCAQREASVEFDSQFCDDDLTPTEESERDIVTEATKKPIMTMSSLSSSSISPNAPWYSGLLTQEDFELVDPHRARFLSQLRNLSNRKQAILNCTELSEKEKTAQIQELTLTDPPCKLEDLR